MKQLKTIFKKSLTAALVITVGDPIAAFHQAQRISHCRRSMSPTARSPATLRRCGSPKTGASSASMALKFSRS